MRSKLNPRRFYKELDWNSQEDILTFLTQHERSQALGPENPTTSYANCIRLHEFGLSSEQIEGAREILHMPDVHRSIDMVLKWWGMARNWKWQVIFRQDDHGYLVLSPGSITYLNGQPLIRAHPENGLDHGTCYDQWDMARLRSRAKLVQSFDSVCDQAVQRFEECC